MLNLLKQLYPINFLVIVFMPIILGLFIDYELFNGRYIFINLIWMVLFTIPRLFFKNANWLYKLGSCIFFTFGFVEIIHWVSIKGPITITSLLVIFNTNIHEAVEFVGLKASVSLLLLIPYFWVFIMALKHKFHSTDQSKKNKIIVLFILLVSIVFIGENSINGRLVRKGVPQVIKVAYSFVDKLKLFNEAAKKNYPKSIEVNSSISENKQLFVLILGESCNRNHMSIYGYHKKTTPLLEKRNDIYVYTDVVAPYSNTLNSIYTILTESNLEHPIHLGSAVDLIDVFHSANYKTYWVSNQSPIGIWDNMVTVMANKTDYSKFVNLSSNSSYEAVLTSSYDDRVFEPFIEVLSENVKNKFVIVHLMGSHSSYAKRYPRSFKKFKPSGDKKQKTIDHYDNSILYNDFIVDSLINAVKLYAKKENEVASVIYIADHGENVYDENDRVGHDYSNRLPKANVEIPFIVWLSDAYKSIYPHKEAVIEKHQKLPFVTDDLFHAVIDINHFESEYYNRHRSIFDSIYNRNRVRVLEDGKDYDE